MQEVLQDDLSLFAVPVFLIAILLAVALMFKLHEISPLRDVVGRQWWAWLLLFFLEDLTFYWFHRMNHEVRLLWAGLSTTIPPNT